MGSQIKIEWIFSVVGIITNLKQSKLGIENLNWLIFIIKNWPNGAYVECDGPSKLNIMVKFLKMDFVMIEKYRKMIKEQNLVEEDKFWFQLISSLIFFFHPQCVFFFVSNFSHANILIVSFSWCICNIETEDWRPTLCCNVGYFFTLHLL